MTRETWYLLEDGTVGDPREIARGADGRLHHKDGRAVAYAPHGPRSRGVDDPDAERAKAKPQRAKEVERPVVETKDMKPASGKGYRTRDTKAD